MVDVYKRQSLIGILLIVSGVCDLFVKKTKEMEIEENDERNISLSNAAMEMCIRDSHKSRGHE